MDTSHAVRCQGKVQSVHFDTLGLRADVRVLCKVPHSVDHVLVPIRTPLHAYGFSYVRKVRIVNVEEFKWRLEVADGYIQPYLAQGESRRIEERKKSASGRILGSSMQTISLN